MPPARSPLRRLLPALLALVLQIVAPVWAFADSGQQDPVAAGVICGGGTDTGRPGPHRHAQVALCPAGHLCCGFHVALLPAPQRGLPHPRGIIGRPDLRFAVAQPRGPPAVAANARAPPTVS